MKITVDDQLFDTIPGLCIGVVALRAADNRDVNLEAEAFRRRCCTEANLLLKMNPHIADQEIERYQNVLKKLSITGESGLAKTFAEYKKDLGLFEKEEAAETPMEILPAPKMATLDELAGSDVLPRQNPILDMVRAGMLKFHVDIHAYDMGDRSRTLSIRKTEDDVTVWRRPLHHRLAGRRSKGRRDHPGDRRRSHPHHRICAEPKESRRRQK